MITISDIRALQTSRFHRDYADFFSDPEAAPTVDFFFRRIYSDDFEESGAEQLARKAWRAVRNIFPENNRRRMDSLFALHELTAGLDSLMAEKAVDFGLKQLSLQHYDQLYAACANESDRREQLQLLLENFDSFFRFSRKRSFRAAMVPLSAVAKRLSAGSIIALINDGYEASKRISEPRFSAFLAAIRDREDQLLNRLFPQG